MKRETPSPGTQLNPHLIASDVEEDAFGASYLVASGKEGQAETRLLIREFFPASLAVRRSGHIMPASRDGVEAYEAAKTRCGEVFDRLAELRHDSLVPVLDRFFSNNTHYFVSAWPTGETLSEIVAAHGPLAVEDLRALFDILLPALTCLEQAGVVHGGLSPDTIFRREDGLPMLNVPAFPGLANQFPVVPLSANEATNFSAPEQYQAGGPAELTSAADIYGLGALGYFLLTATLPPMAEARLTALSAGEPDPIDWSGVEAACGEDAVLLNILQAILSLPADARPSGFDEVAAMLRGEVQTETAPLFSKTDEISPVKPRFGMAAKLAIGMAAGMVAAFAMFLIVPGYLPMNLWDTARAEPLKPQQLNTPEQQAATVNNKVALADETRAKTPPEVVLPAPDDVTKKAGVETVVVPKEPEDEKPLEAETVKAEPPQVPESPMIEVGKPFRDCENCPQVVRLPTGQFTMGAGADEPGAMASERPARMVSVNHSIAVTTHEITVGEYKAYLKATGKTADELCSVHSADRAAYWQLESGRSVTSPGFMQTNSHPAVCVSWQDAKDYAAWLSKSTGERYRLPTEAEWEYAARGGTKSAYFWGADTASTCQNANGGDVNLTRQTGLDWLVNSCSDGAAFTSPVGRYAANPFGLFDMAGNVSEWVEDCRTEDYSGASVNAARAAGGECRFRGVRGGSWAGSADQLRAARRHFMPATVRYNTTGFRLVRDVE